MTQTLLVTQPAELAEAVRELRAVPRIGLDTEGNGMHAYRTRLCVLQLCACSDDAPAERVYIVDALAMPDLRPLGEILGPDGPEVVIHDVAFDARLLASVGLPLANVLDTALHARFLGLPETGLGALLANRLGVQVSKELQQDDWSRRPLRDEQLVYLADDVRHLGPLAAGLALQAATAGITEEVRVETEYAMANARAGEPDLPPYARIKDARKLLPVARAVLRELAQVREAAAQAWDAPVGRVVSNALLVQLATRRPGTVAEVKKQAGLHGRSATMAADFLAAIQRGEQAGDVPEAERALFAYAPVPPREQTARRAREQALSAWRKAEAAARGVDAQVVLPGHALSDVARAGPGTLDGLRAVPGFGEVRVARYGEAVLNALALAQAAAQSSGEKKQP